MSTHRSILPLDYLSSTSWKLENPIVTFVMKASSVQRSLTKKEEEIGEILAI